MVESALQKGTEEMLTLTALTEVGKSVVKSYLRLSQALYNLGYKEEAAEV